MAEPIEEKHAKNSTDMLKAKQPTVSALLALLENLAAQKSACASRKFD